jgi:predicted metal-binding membrane protein
MSSMPAMSATRMALMMVAMMVAMMLPSVAPDFWRYYRRLRAMRLSHAGRQTMLFAAGYASVWTTIGLALFGLNVLSSQMFSDSSLDRPFAPWAAGLIILCAGALQRSSWKATHLECCRRAFALPCTMLGDGPAQWREGCRLGVHCVKSCSAMTAILIAIGLMDLRAMLVIAAVTAAERLAPAGPRIARLTGALGMGAGLVMCLRAIELVR